MRKLPRQPEVNIGTSGHVDHGKTTLVQAITGIWTSAHSEELRRGITIKVGYADAAFYKCPDCSNPECYGTSPEGLSCNGEAQLKRVVSFVDCPGHESLMANMLSGAAVMDGSILVIACNEKVPQPQTREHLLALQMLGMRQIVITQNKVDLVTDDEALENYESIKKFVDGSVAADAPVVPISAQQKVNIDALIKEIEDRIPTPERNVSAPPTLQVLRSFDVNKPGQSVKELRGGVVGGTLLQGELEVGEEIELRPGTMNDKNERYEPIHTRVASLGTSSGMVERVRPGGLVAVGTYLDPSLTKGDSLVGTVVGRPNELPPVHDRIGMDTNLFETAVGTPDLVRVERIRVGENLRLNAGTALTQGAVSSVREDYVEVNLRKPVCAASPSRVAISRRIVDRWRLIGSGLIK